MENKKIEVNDLDKYFIKQKLVPAIIQEEDTGRVLMLAYMNKESLVKTLETGYTWFYSRSRQELWNKGATSGHLQEVLSITPDCDNDTFSVKVNQTGAACHTGNKTCFYKGEDVIKNLYDVVESRKKEPQEGSYTCYLFEQGLNKILKKCGEECAETIISAKDYNASKEFAEGKGETVNIKDNENKKNDLENEICDLIYHLVVMMSQQEIPLEDIYYILDRRSRKIGNLKKFHDVDRNS